ncbi:hypothetical protein D7Y15_12870 [Corallococcus sp. AB030]|uniref:Uncharacterized protein n=1 Tax=Corallococcus sicarius TaxID=2316726 RepID=A0A3A8N915_9BACT|nr:MULTISPECIES: hypothetical protein [Corallococcus]NRD51905.1 hypothetical protein [Corallococcus exiguus]RKH40433.1 hypothetical protein D7X12_20895 [Corallococcus sicarius]RKI15930.1 hypothetical protein D7Y15_12870 [Corallococcus sp. AB030]
MTASSNERGRGRFRAIVEQTIQLARAMDEEYERLYPSTGGLLTASDLVRREVDALTGVRPRPAEQAFNQHLQVLDAADLVALVTLHYVGRDFQETDKPEKVLQRQRIGMKSSRAAEDAREKLSERSRLDGLLVQGLRKARSIGLDIEALPLTK